MRGFALGAFAVALLAWASPGRAGEPQSLEERMAGLEGQVAALDKRLAAVEAVKTAGNGTTSNAPTTQERAAAEAVRRAIERAYAGRAGLQTTLMDQVSPEHAVELRASEARIDAGQYGAAKGASSLVLRLDTAYLRCVLCGAQRQRLPGDAESALFDLERALRDCAWPDVMGALDRMDAAMPRKTR